MVRLTHNGLRRRLACATLAVASLLLLAPNQPATAAPSTTCKAADAKARRLRFNYLNGSIQICAKVGSSYKWRTATAAEAQRPYIGYLRPLPTSTYLSVSPELAGEYVAEFASIFADRDVNSLFAGFVAVGVKSNASPNEFDSIAIIFPYSKLGRALIGGADPAELNEGSTTTIAGRPVAYRTNGTVAAYTYVGQTAIVQFEGDGQDQTYLPNIVSEWLTAHGAV
jgi:hypothetical protein